MPEKEADYLLERAREQIGGLPKHAQEIFQSAHKRAHCGSAGTSTRGAALPTIRKRWLTGSPGAR